MKSLISTLLSFIALTAFAQTPKPELDGNTWEAPYTLQVPKDWGVERFSIPIGFAPQIPYNGVEDIRFAPGWANAKSNEYWTYAFLWYLDDIQKINAEIISSHLKAYYTGLIAVNAASSSMHADQEVAVETKIKKVKTNKGDSKTFRGTIYLVDYMAKTPITLHCIVHLKFYPLKYKTFLFFEISPKPYDDKVWQGLHQLWADFNIKTK